MLGMSRANGDTERRDAAGRLARKPRHWAYAKAENPLGSFVPFSSLVGTHDVITRGGDYLRIWRLDGVAFECADEHRASCRSAIRCSSAHSNATPSSRQMRR